MQPSDRRYRARRQSLPWRPQLAIAVFSLGFLLGAAAAENAPRKPPVMANLLAASQPADWRPLDPHNTLYLEVATGRVVIELAPAFVPHHVTNIKTLVREGYFDGPTINRAQDNYVVQWSDADAKRSVGSAKPTL